MDQQLIERVVEIIPANMDELLDKIQAVLTTCGDDPQVQNNVVKSLFYGLWNFDKMINQHNLNTRISQLLGKLPRKISLLFLETFIDYLQQKWTLIDHHRINKFMQLVRYLIIEAFRMAERGKGIRQKIDQILLKKVFLTSQMNNGLAQHITDIYFQILEQALSHPPTLQDFSVFENILTSHSNEAFRLYVTEHIYEPFKRHLFQIYKENVEGLESALLEFSQYFLSLAKKEQKDLHRKNLYALVGFAKSSLFSFAQYVQEKREKQAGQQEKRKKRLTKGKKQEVRKLRVKRKGKDQGRKTKKIMSVRKFDDKNRMKKYIEEL